MALNDQLDRPGRTEHLTHEPGCQPRKTVGIGRQVDVKESGAICSTPLDQGFAASGKEGTDLGLTVLLVLRDHREVELDSGCATGILHELIRATYGKNNDAVLDPS